MGKVDPVYFSRTAGARLCWPMVPDLLRQGLSVCPPPGWSRLEPCVSRASRQQRNDFRFVPQHLEGFGSSGRKPAKVEQATSTLGF